MAAARLVSKHKMEVEAAKPWTERYPKTGQLVKGALDTLPAVGGIVGGALSTPETLGVGTIPGVALGVGAGRGARDLAAEALGVDYPSSPTAKAARIAADTAVAGVTQAVMPGVAHAVKEPIATLRELSSELGSLLPARLRAVIGIPQMIEKAAEPIMKRPYWQTLPDAAQTTIDRLRTRMNAEDLAKNPQARAAIATAIKKLGGTP